MSTLDTAGMRPASSSHPILQGLPARVLAPGELERLVRSVAMAEELWRGVVRHSPVRRWHKRLHHNIYVEVWLLGWTFDQETRIHDHGSSVGAFGVAQGWLGEEYATVGADRLRLRRHMAGDAVSFGTTYVHNLGNRSFEPATSVHAYSPPLQVMRFYTPDADGRLVATYQLPVAGPEADWTATPEPLRVGG